MEYPFAYAGASSQQPPMVHQRASYSLPSTTQPAYLEGAATEVVGAGCGGCGRCAGCAAWLASSGAGQLLADLTGHLCRHRPLRPLPSALSFLSMRAEAANAATAALRRHPSFSVPASSSFSLPPTQQLPLQHPAPYLEGLDAESERPSKVLKHYHQQQQQPPVGYDEGPTHTTGLSAPGSAPEVPQASRLIFVEPLNGETAVSGGAHANGTALDLGQGGMLGGSDAGALHFEGFETVNFEPATFGSNPSPSSSSATTLLFGSPAQQQQQQQQQQQMQQQIAASPLASASSAPSSALSSPSGFSVPAPLSAPPSTSPYAAGLCFKRRPSIALPSPIPLTSEEQAIGRRRRAIFGESVEPAGLLDASSPATRPHPKSAEAQQALEEALKTNIMFSHLERDDRAELFDAMFEVKFAPGDVIIQQGDEGDNFYVVEKGTCEVWKSIDGNEPELVLTIGEGGSFGELALIYGTQRAATVKARTPVVLWAIHRSTYRRVLMGATLRKRTLYESFLKNVPILAPLERYERLMVADALDAEIFPDGTAIITQGEVGDAFYIIVEGQVRVTQGDDEVARLGPSAYFGEIALLTNQPRRATVTAVGDTKCARISRKKFFRVMGPCQDVLKQNMLRLYPQYAEQL